MCKRCREHTVMEAEMKWVLCGDWALELMWSWDKKQPAKHGGTKWKKAQRNTALRKNDALLHGIAAALTHPPKPGRMCEINPFPMPDVEHFIVNAPETLTMSFYFGTSTAQPQRGCVPRGGKTEGGLVVSTAMGVFSGASGAWYINTWG